MGNLRNPQQRQPQRPEYRRAATGAAQRTAAPVKPAARAQGTQARRPAAQGQRPPQKRNYRPSSQPARNTGRRPQNMRKKKKNTPNYTVIAFASVSVVLLIAIIIGIVAFSKKNSDTPENSSIIGLPEETRGVWIASAYNINFPSKSDLTKDELKAELDSIVANAKEMGLNCIFYQVRPSSDALYKSDYFPVSKYLSTEENLTLDTLEYLIEAAHRENIAVHAWINPLRVTSKATEVLSEDNPAAKNPDWCVEYADGGLYYNCGIPDVRQLVADGVREIVENYDVDGIVFDDYFYPYPKTVDGEIAEFDDKATYRKYCEDGATVADFRRDSVNRLVRLCYETVKEVNKDCAFGVSPFGIWKNGTGAEDGSLSRGMQSYSDIYCDTISWVNDGYVDYIAPQIYWRTEDTAAPYDKIFDWWSYMLEDTDVALLVSHAAYRYDNDWQSPEGTLKSQIEYSENSANYKGSIFYGYEAIKNNASSVKDEICGIYSASIDTD